MYICICLTYRFVCCSTGHQVRIQSYCNWLTQYKYIVINGGKYVNHVIVDLFYWWNIFVTIKEEDSIVHHSNLPLYLMEIIYLLGCLYKMTMRTIMVLLETYI